jgi:hypothetical protein
MMHHQFAERAVRGLQDDPAVVGLAAGGSWLENTIDEYSDLDLVLVTEQRVSHDKTAMLGYAGRMGTLLSGFTGEHVGEPRLLICLYDEPLLHVDIKFLTLDEVRERVEDPAVLLDRDGRLAAALAASEARFPMPDFQWIEDRFWIWVHYLLCKIGRGEYFEALDGLSFLRGVVLGPLLHLASGQKPRGVRKVETLLKPADLQAFKSTVAVCDRTSLLSGLQHSVALYRRLRDSLYGPRVILQTATEHRVMRYWDEIQLKNG